MDFIVVDMSTGATVNVVKGPLPNSRVGLQFLESEMREMYASLNMTVERTAMVELPVGEALFMAINYRVLFMPIEAHQYFVIDRDDLYVVSIGLVEDESVEDAIIQSFRLK